MLCGWGCEAPETLGHLRDLDARTYTLAESNRPADWREAERLIEAELADGPAGAPVQSVRCARGRVAFGEAEGTSADRKRVVLCTRLGYVRSRLRDRRGAFYAYAAALPGAHLLKPEVRVLLLQSVSDLASQVHDTTAAVQAMDDAERVARANGLQALAVQALRCKLSMMESGGVVPLAVRTPDADAGLHPGAEGLFILGVGLWLGGRRAKRRAATTEPESPEAPGAAPAAG